MKTLSNIQDKPRVSKYLEHFGNCVSDNPWEYDKFQPTQWLGHNQGEHRIQKNEHHKIIRGKRLSIWKPFQIFKTNLGFQYS